MRRTGGVGVAPPLRLPVTALLEGDARLQFEPAGENRPSLDVEAAHGGANMTEQCYSRATEPSTKRIVPHSGRTHIKTYYVPESAWI